MLILALWGGTQNNGTHSLVVEFRHNGICTLLADKRHFNHHDGCHFDDSTRKHLATNRRHCALNVGCLRAGRKVLRHDCIGTGETADTDTVDSVERRGSVGRIVVAVVFVFVVVAAVMVVIVDAVMISCPTLGTITLQISSRRAGRSRRKVRDATILNRLFNATREIVTAAVLQRGRRAAPLGKKVMRRGA